MPSDIVSVHSHVPAGPFKAFWNSFSESRGAVVGLVVVALIVLTAIFAPVLAPYNPLEQFKGLTKLPPFWVEGADPRYWLGTDAVGRDMLSRLMYGARISLFIGIAAILISEWIGERIKNGGTG